MSLANNEKDMIYGIKEKQGDLLWPQEECECRGDYYYFAHFLNYFEGITELEITTGLTNKL